MKTAKTKNPTTRLSDGTCSIDPIIITLSVDTENIEQDNIEKYCHFGQHSEKLEEYTTDAKVGDFIIWRGVPTEKKDDIVNIKSIRYEKGTKIFKKKKLRGDGGNPKMVIGRVLKNTETDFKYKIRFNVIHKGAKQKVKFFIDPKIRVVD